ncbi:MAG TPA: SpoIIE family protein phosphatase [Solirubrobacteraceae bacterium]|jgi:PAS domain S-box-containing protein|nr:SpoIIE family protein phosphatase [Solirubrobacteraceae bacterium]
MQGRGVVRVLAPRAVELLVEAGAVVASSLDPAETMQRVANLTVPRLADLCAIDLLDEDGTITEVAVASAEPKLAPALEDLRRRHPLDPDGEHPVARVIRSGQAELLGELSQMALRSFAQGSEHARFMVSHRYRSAAVAPLAARGRTLGTLSILRLGESEPLEEEDLELACELARRAAMAIDNARLFARARGVEQRLEAVLANVAEAITLSDRQGRTVFANQAAAELLGVGSPAELTRAPAGAIMSRFLVTDEHGRELALEQMPSRRLFAGERPEPLLVRNVVRSSGEERWLIARSSPVYDPDSGAIAYAVNVFENITGVKRVQLAESFMAEASRVLASSLDYEHTLQRIARLAVPQLADWCAVDVLEDGERIRRVAVHHGDPRRIALAERLERGYHETLDRPRGLAEVIRSGRPRLYSGVDRAALAAFARDEQHLALLEQVGARDVIIVPLAAPARTLGAITLVSAESRRRLTSHELDVAVRLGRRAGTAVESARLYTERTRIARALEEALLPESLPEIPGLEIASRYRAAGELNDVGGDFYDVLPYGRERWLLVIGDVCGKGPRAAGVTALARHTLRTAAHLGQTPAGMLATLHEALRGQPPGRDLCTACLVAVELAGERVRLRLVLAGHPRPLLIDAEGGCGQVGVPGTLLGVVDPIALHETLVELAPGQTLLLYTDGLPEAGRATAQLDEQALLGLCAQARGRTLDGVLGRIEQLALERAGGRLRDDIALLAVRISRPNSPAGRA